MRRSLAAALSIFVLIPIAFGQKAVEIPNPSIDMVGFLDVAKKAAEHRQTRRLSEDQFIAMSKEPEVVILDARSKQMYDALHIENAVNLSFPDITVDSLAKLLPDKNTTILIYCNNNFTNSEGIVAVNPFPTKIATASLNLSTYVSLYSYGYRNIYELGPLLDLKKTKIKMASSPPKAAEVTATSTP